MKLLSKQKEFNKFDRLKKKICRIKSDIFFLSQCKKMKLFPKFIQIRSLSSSPTGKRAIMDAKRRWLINELRFQYSRLADTEMESYSLHQNIANNVPDLVLDYFQRKIEYNCSLILRREIASKKEKLRCLQQSNYEHFGNRKSKKNKPEIIKNFVVNKSSEHFTEDELNVLNNGLNFAVPTSNVPLKDMIVDVEVALRQVNFEETNLIRSSIKDCLSKIKYETTPDKTIYSFHQSIKSLNQKDVYITKADKGNAIVILDKSKYDEYMQLLIDNGPYKRVRNPLNKMKNKWEMPLRNFKTFLV